MPYLCVKVRIWRTSVTVEPCMWPSDIYCRGRSMDYGAIAPLTNYINSYRWLVLLICVNSKTYNDSYSNLLWICWCVIMRSVDVSAFPRR